MITFIRERFHPLWRLRQNAWYRKLQRRVDFPVWVRGGRIKFQVMFLRDCATWAPHRGAEDTTRRVFQGMLREFGATHFFDIGANTGTYSWTALEAAPELEVFLFEPDPVNAKLLRATLKKNGLERVRLWEGAVAEQGGKRVFHVDEASGTVGSLRDDSAKDYSLQAGYQVDRKIEVPVTTLDDYLEQVPGERPQVAIKVDVEGSEKEVIEGGRRFIAKFRPWMIVECFERENLRAMRGLEYVAIDLREGANVLLIPREREGELRAKRLVPEGEAAQALG